MDNGLVPVGSFSTLGVNDFCRALDSLEGEEKVKAQRKFRKLFRKMWKNARQDRHQQARAERFGIGNSQPTKQQLRARRRWVHHNLMNNIS